MWRNLVLVVASLVLAIGLAGSSNRASKAAAALEITGVRTLVSLRTGIDQFAQDGQQIAWIATSAKAPAARLVVRSLTTGKQTALSTQRGHLCSYPCGYPAALSVANNRVVYALELQSLSEVGEDFYAVATSDRQERLLFRCVFAYSEDYADVQRIARGDGSNSIAVATGISEGGGYGSGGNKLWQVDARGHAKNLMPTRTTSVALAGGRIAVAPTSAPMIELRDLHGRLIRAIKATFKIQALALSRAVVAAVDVNNKLQVYSVTNGKHLWSSQLAPPRADNSRISLSVAGMNIVYNRGKRVFLADVKARRTRLLAHAASDVIGLSIERNRVAWAENLGEYPHITGRIRALDVTR
jgi:hypothetical protein